jgi:hypothetical protein
MSDEQKTAIELARDKAEAEVATKNEARKGIGPRLFVGSTRGKSPQVITYEAFDESLPDTLPKTPAEFVEAVKPENDSKVLEYLIRGYNAVNLELASDPLSEYVVAKWAPEVQTTFRTACRNYAKGLGIQLEDAVNIIRPGFVAKFGE